MESQRDYIRMYQYAKFSFTLILLFLFVNNSYSQRRKNKATQSIVIGWNYDITKIDTVCSPGGLFEWRKQRGKDITSVRSTFSYWNTDSLKTVTFHDTIIIHRFGSEEYKGTVEFSKGKELVKTNFLSINGFLSSGISVYIDSYIPKYSNVFPTVIKEYDLFLGGSTEILFKPWKRIHLGISSSFNLFKVGYKQVHTKNPTIPPRLRKDRDYFNPRISPSLFIFRLQFHYLFH